jgi:uncharacterized repeat protein (TIGR03803 family)
MTKIILGNANNLSVSDDNSNGDTIIVGNGIDDTVSANGSNYNTITLGNGAGDSVTANGSSYDMITLGNGAGDAVNAKYSSYDTITLGNGNDTVTVGANSNITAGNCNDMVTAGPGSTISLGNGNDTVTAGSGSTISPPPITTLLPTLTTLVSFNYTNGATPVGGLIADAAGDLFGMTLNGGANDVGTVFELVNNGGGSYTPTTLEQVPPLNSQVYYPPAGLIMDAAGDLFGTTAFGGANGDGTVFELVNNGGGSYASTPNTLVSFNVTNGAVPLGGLIADAAGDLFGMTFAGGANGDGTVFEIVKTSTGFASTPTTLFSFNGTNGSRPEGSLIADAAGDLFGTTDSGGLYGGGTVFEIAKTSTGYASMPTTLASFNGSTNGGGPEGGLIMDAAGDLFGTTVSGGCTTGARCSSW